MSRAVVGFCRFSFVGRGDWARYRSIERGSESEELLQQVAQELYAPERMARRFASFENVTLPSILAQSDQDFTYVVITSQAMPEIYKARLAELCARSKAIRLVIADSPELTDVTTPILQDLSDRHEQVVQFRLDDDDAIAQRYVERVHDYSERMRGLDAFALTFARGLSSVTYPDEKTWYAEFRLPFQSAAAIIKFTSPTRSVFSVGHFAMQRNYTHIQDVQNFGAFMMKWPSDSRRFRSDAPPNFMETIPRHKFLRLCREHFPGLEGVDLDAIARGPVPA